MLQKDLNHSRHLDLHQRRGWRQTEYQRPRFSSRQCGSEQSFLRVSASAVGSEGGGVADESEHAAKMTIMTAMIPGLTARLLSPRLWILGASGGDCKPGRTASSEAVLGKRSLSHEE